MAVSNQDAPNLTPAYGQIISQLQNRASMERERPSFYNVGTSVVKRVDQELTKRRDLQKAFDMEMKKEGRVLWTPEESAELAKDLELDPSEFSRFEGLHIKPKEAESFAKQLKFVRSLPPEEQPAAEVSPEKAAEAKLSKKPKVKFILHLETEGIKDILCRKVNYKKFWQKHPTLRLLFSELVTNQTYKKYNRGEIYCINVDLGNII